MTGSNKRKAGADEVDNHPINNINTIKQRQIMGKSNMLMVSVIHVNAFIVTQSSRRKTSKPSAARPFPFFRLPREIRDEILVLCLLSPDTMITGGDYPHPPYLGWYNDLCAPLDLYCPGRPTFALFTVSKQMHEEAAFNLYTRSRFQFLIATTHCANLINPPNIENNTIQIAPRYLRMMKRVVLVVAIEAFCCHLPRYQYIRVKNAIQKFADDLGGSDRELVHLSVRYTEFESNHTRATHIDARRRPDHEWTRSQVMDHLRVEFNSKHHLGYPGPHIHHASHQYQNVLEPLGMVFGIDEVLVYGVEAEFGAKLQRTMQSKEKLCEPKAKITHGKKDRVRRQRVSRAIKWWDSTFEWKEAVPWTMAPLVGQS